MNRAGNARNFIGVRVRQGEEHHAAILTAAKVREMRVQHQKIGLCVKCIAILQGVKYQTAWEAINYVTWRHVLEER